MVDGEYKANIFNSLNISIGTVIRTPEILKFVPDYPKTKYLCKHNKKLLFVIRYVTDRYIRVNKCMIKQF